MTLQDVGNKPTLLFFQMHLSGSMSRPSLSCTHEIFLRCVHMTDHPTKQSIVAAGSSQNLNFKEDTQEITPLRPIFGFKRIMRGKKRGQFENIIFLEVKKEDETDTKEI